ncbi:MAG: hypothetical protein NTY19_04105 [Planctomycetota bacterium]|nr:hypothetical protein [Planctomycetota bacterium]
MYRNGRPIDPQFLGSEKLYFRCKREWIDDGDRVLPGYIHFPDQSVNREKYSKPADVLLPDGTERSRDWILWGVAKVTADDVPASISTEGKVCYEFSVEHDPEEDNYSPSELRVYKGGKRESNSGKINQQVKKKYRTMVALKALVVVQPLA